MELRLDRLLADLRRRTEAVLEAIDRDPLLLKRESGGLVLANPSKELYTPQQEHQLFAKGVVYRRAPYRLVSLPLVKIYNVGERDVTVADLARLGAEPGTRLRFLRKIDGTLVQAFRADGRVWFTTRGMIEGAKLRAGQESGEARAAFDYLGTVRRLAAQRYPRLLEDESLLEEQTLVFELIHPQAQQVTNYGDREDLVLLACFDRRRCAYRPHEEVAALALAHGLTAVDALAPRGGSLAEQIDGLLAALAGTDQEGSVLTFERGGEVVYRVKVKSPDYLRLMRRMSECTYERTAALLDANPHLANWADLEAHLKALGREEAPEEVLPFYRQHYDRHADYLAACERLRAWAARECQALRARLAGHDREGPAAYRKAFAALAKERPQPGLLFLALDGKLDLGRVRQVFPAPEQVREALRGLGG
ncbi:MAG TPA: hypothetical protein VFE78_21590 [Gemmataceae bacterium]|nr:hypothetical protein [Gemmataceae bacterium]